MSVGKIFKVLIIVVACVILGAVILNVLLPNATQGMINAVENTIYNATGLQLDFNGDGTVSQTEVGSQVNSGKSKLQDDNGDEGTAGQVKGYN